VTVAPASAPWSSPGLRLITHTLVGVPWWKLPLSGEPYRYTLLLLLSLPLAVWSLLDRGSRPLLGMNGEYRDAWGGPTLAGAWAVHALGGIAFLLLVPWVLRGHVALWRRLMGI
jgi:hypothetical protein